MKPRTHREKRLVSYASKLLNEAFGIMAEGTSKAPRTGDNNRDGNIGEFITGWSLGTGNYTVPSGLAYHKKGSKTLDPWMNDFMQWAKNGNTDVPNCWVEKNKKVVLNTAAGWKYEDEKIVYPSEASKKSWMACLLMATHEKGEYRGLAPGPAEEGADLAGKIKAHFIDQEVYSEDDFDGGLDYDSLLWPAVVQTKTFGFENIEQADIIVLGKGDDDTQKKEGAMGYSLKVGGSTPGQANLGAADYFAEYNINSTEIVSAGVLAFLKQAVSDLWSSQSKYFSGDEPTIDTISEKGLTVTKRRKSDVCENGKLLQAINAVLETSHTEMSDLDEMPDWDPSYAIKYTVDGKDKTLVKSDYNQLKAVHSGGISISDGGVRKVDRSLADSDQNIKVGEIEGNVTTHIGKALASCAVQLFTAPGAAKDLVDKIITMSGVFGTNDKGPNTDVTYCVSPKGESVEHPTHVYPGVYIACSDADPNDNTRRIPKELKPNDFQWSKESDKNTVYIGYNETALMRLSIRTSSPSGSVFTATATVSPYGKLEVAEDGTESIKEKAPSGTDWKSVGELPQISDDETEREIASKLPDAPPDNSGVSNANNAPDDPKVTVNLGADAIPFKDDEGNDAVSDQTLSMTIDGDLDQMQSFLEAINRHAEMDKADEALGTDTKGQTLKKRVAAIMDHIKNLGDKAQQQEAMRQVMGMYYEEAGIPFQERIQNAWNEFSAGIEDKQFGKFPNSIRAKAAKAGIKDNVGDMMEWWITQQSKKNKIKLAQPMTPQQIKATTKDGRKYNKEDFAKVFVSEKRRIQFANLLNETIRTVILLENEEGDDTQIDAEEAVASDFSYTDPSTFANWLLGALGKIPEDAADKVLDAFSDSDESEVIDESRWLKLAGLLKG